MTRLRCLSIGLLLAALSACSGTDEGRPSGERAAAPDALDQCKLGDALELTEIARFEPMGDRATCDLMGCTFYFNLDKALSPENPEFPDLAAPMPLPNSDREPECPPGAMTTSNIPMPGGYVPVTPLPEERCASSESGMHFWGKDLAVCVRPETGRPGWGAAIDVNLVPEGRTLDASEFDGVVFWARRGPGLSGSAIIFSVADQFTSGRGALEDPDTGELVRCDTSDPSTASMPVPDAEKCDAFGTTVTLVDKWTYVKVPFVTLRQKGFGLPSPLGMLDVTELVRFQFLMSSGDWDFWVDNVAFYRETE
jgi:hypothetical protein